MTADENRDSAVDSYLHSDEIIEAWRCTKCGKLDVGTSSPIGKCRCCWLDSGYNWERVKVRRLEWLSRRREFYANVD